MPTPTAEHDHMVSDLLLPELVEMLDAHDHRLVRGALTELLDPEVADMLLALDETRRVVVFLLLPRNRAADVFTFLPSDAKEEMLAALDRDQLAQLVSAMAPDDRVEVFEELPEKISGELLDLLRPRERQETQVILNHPPESVGRLMTPRFLTLRTEWTARQALDHLRQHGSDAETLETSYVVDPAGKLVDDVRLRQLVLADPDARIDSLIDGIILSLRATDDREDAVRMLDRYDRPVLPVVDDANVLLGIVTFDDIADVAAQETTEDIHKLGGVEALDVPYLTVPLMELVRKRGTWLSVLFLGEMLTATAMQYFQGEIERAAVLALFLPLIISSGGNSGSQASTLVVRAMALREVGMNTWWPVLRRELLCGLMLGLLLGAIGLTRIHLWQWLGFFDYGSHYHLLAATVAAALVGVVLWGSLMGSMLPILLRALRLDPASISAPMVATLVDVTGLIIYFSTAYLILRGTLL